MNCAIYRTHRPTGSHHTITMAACATKAVCVAKPNAPALRANPRRPSPVVARFGMPRMDQTLCGGQGFSRPNGHRASRRVVMAGRVGTGTNVEPPLGVCACLLLVASNSPCLHIFTSPLASAVFVVHEYVHSNVAQVTLCHLVEMADSLVRAAAAAAAAVMAVARVALVGSVPAVLVRAAWFPGPHSPAPKTDVAFTLAQMTTWTPRSPPRCWLLAARSRASRRTLPPACCLAR